MKLLRAFCSLLVVAAVAVAQDKFICYYDSKSHVREHVARMLPLDLEPALSFCTHLVYGYAGIQPDTYKMVPLNENLDVDRMNARYRTITDFKIKYPGLKVLLSVGGDADVDSPEKYNLLLESPTARTAFVNSGVLLAEQHGFDGIDLAWQFPKIKSKRIRSSIGSIWNSIKLSVGVNAVDAKEAEHREGYTALVRELKESLSVRPNMQLSITVIPNVNATIYYDVPDIIDLVDIVNLESYDYQTAERSPTEADYMSPIYNLQNRNDLLNVNADVTYWITSGAPSQKIVIGIATHGRTWKLDSDSDIYGAPPLHADGPGEAGPYTKVEGILSYPEICAELINPNHQKGRPPLTKVTDPSKRFGTYAYRLPVPINDNSERENGLWISYEDPDTAATYAKFENYGGVSIKDMSMDDYRGLCTAMSKNFNSKIECCPYTKIKGKLRYPEICTKLMYPNHQIGWRPHKGNVTDQSKGTYYSFGLRDGSESGLWVSYEDPDTAGQKASYARAKNLGGVSIVDLSMDDFRGLCTGDKFPILRAAKFRL